MTPSVMVLEQFEQTAFAPLVQGARSLAEWGMDGMHRFLASPLNEEAIRCALRIRAVEAALYEAFGRGKLHGTIHTCIGQEFSGALLGRYLRDHDFVTSNHRCHGHFIGATGKWQGLIDEIVGNGDGVCAGIGSSQHMWARNFISNGQQGGLLPVAAGVALDRKRKGGTDAVVSFIGEGTLGEGIVYETLNLDALWDLPHVIVCENNFYSQSTPQERSVAGSIAARGAAFGVETISANTWDLEAFDLVLQQAMESARRESKPTFIALSTYRLNPHSKGDDNRDSAEIAWFRAHDPVTVALEQYQGYTEIYKQFAEEASGAVTLALEKPPLRPQSYFVDQLPRFTADEPEWVRVPAPATSGQRVAQQLNGFYRDWLAEDTAAFFLGEDIADPYGGAFKISKGFTTEFGARVRTTPISEAAICGIGIGLSISGRRALVEIMFGDFITYAFDQIVNNASKMFHMYNGKLNCSVVIRTPMGGRRGYGPTHSQSLERFLIGIDNCCTVSVNSLMAIPQQIKGVKQLRCPIVLLENKSDYSARTFDPPAGYVLSSDDAILPTLRVHAEHGSPAVTVLAYGGMARFVADELLQIFERTDALPELVVPVSISPLNLQPILESVRRTGHLVIAEEGAGFGSVGAEILAQLQERSDRPFTAVRVSGKATPIPSASSLEAAALPSIEDICNAVISAQKARA